MCNRENCIFVVLQVYLSHFQVSKSIITSQWTNNKTFLCYMNKVKKRMGSHTNSSDVNDNYWKFKAMPPKRKTQPHPSALNAKRRLHRKEDDDDIQEIPADADPRLFVDYEEEDES
ncbi:hypothetical protein L596_012923 [Steinernema carpocapsae]|uniref:Uncharacterized protein n=1 Tax=Steinernema carpocapsae TaxID=34508 RepID=A0A4U5NZF1_STECR|nr:hypothetical protein L596_012923 [Steinernema carpocapsae]